MNANLLAKAERKHRYVHFMEIALIMQRLPSHVARKADAICTALKKGKHWSQLGGRKMRHSKTLISFALPSWYRLVCWFNGNDLYQAKTMSHERYNAIAANSRR